MVLVAHIRDQHRSTPGQLRPAAADGISERVGGARRASAGRPRSTGKRSPGSLSRRRWDSDHRSNIAPNLLQQDFSASQPNQKWAGDITCVWTREGWICLAVILDLHSLRVIAQRKPPKGCIHNSDRGSQYCSHGYHKIMRKHRLTASISGKDNCYDNFAVDSFFKSLKAELGWRRNWQILREVEVALCESIIGLLQPKPQTLSLGLEKPRGFRTKSRLPYTPDPNETVTGLGSYRKTLPL